MNLATSRPVASGPTTALLLLAALPLVLKAISMAFGAQGYLAQSGYKIAQIAAPLFWRWHYGHQRGMTIFWPVNEPMPAGRIWARGIVVALLLAGTAIFAVLALAEPLGIDRLQLKAGFDAKFALTSLTAAGIVFYLFTLNAALEELHFRAWLDRELHARWGSVAGWFGSSLVFAAMHLFIFIDLPAATPVLLVLVFFALALAGGLWSWVARSQGGIHAAWLSHGLTDAGLLTWGLFWMGYF